MKKVCGMFVVMALACGGAMASDYTYTETETVVTLERVSIADEMPRFVSSRDVKPAHPCKKHAGEPVRVKTHTEVVDHYMVYQPVTVYKPMGTQIQRRVIPAGGCKHKCNKFAF